MARTADSPVRRRLLLVGLALSVFLVGGWLGRSEVRTVDLGSTGRLLLVSDAGPIVVSSGPALTVTSRDSWLLRRPEIEIAEDAEETVVRSRCPGITPCRSTLEVTVPPGLELVVVAVDGAAHVESFVGQLTVFSAGEDGRVTLGPVSGTARVVAGGGSIEGFGLMLTEMEVEVIDARVSLQFVEAPEALGVRGGKGATNLRLPPEEYEINVATSSETIGVDLESVPDAERTVSVMTEGPVHIGPIEL